MARPEAKIDLAKLEKLCAMQCTDEEIAAFFGVSTKTVERRPKVKRFIDVMQARDGTPGRSSRFLLHWPTGDLQSSPSETQRAYRQSLRSRRYQSTGLGRCVAVLFTKTYGRVLAPGLSALQLSPKTLRHVAVGTAWRCFDRALDEFIHAQLTAP
jgi:hypothetical protein